MAKDRSMSGRVKIERSSGNVFTDLGFPKAEAKNLALRSLLMSEIREIARSMTKAKAVKRFGITQARLEDLLRGRIGKLSVDALMNMATAGGLHVQPRTGEVP
jgi:predicted XRE-type DNA-binding protein